jgi:hypothetical protein
MKISTQKRIEKECPSQRSESKIRDKTSEVRFFVALRMTQILVCFILSIFVTAPGIYAQNRAPSEDSKERAVLQRWKVSFELAFGDNSPYSKKFPNLYELPYQTNYAITRDVLNQIARVAQNETKIKSVQLIYAPGGYGDYVNPSAQWDVEATSSDAATLMDTVGYLAQQTEVIASRVQPNGESPALQIVEQKTRKFSSPQFVTRFWKRLRHHSPWFAGFLPVKINGQPGIRIIDTEKSWTARDIIRADYVVENVSRELGIKTTTKRFFVQSLSTRNDWKSHSSGSEYLSRLQQRGRGALVTKLVKIYRPQVEKWIRAAFGKYACRDAIHRVSDSSRLRFITSHSRVSDSPRLSGAFKSSVDQFSGLSLMY